MSETAYPLSWPTGWKRTPSYHRQTGAFGERRQGVSMTSALDALELQLDRMRASQVVISTNVQTRLDGRPYANQRQPQDPGGAVYFTLKGKRVVLACDSWLKPETNLWAIAKHIDALRGQERWGVGSIEQAFQGYAALPETTQKPWWEVFGVNRDTHSDAVISCYKSLLKNRHPDTGGSHESFIELQEAYRIFQLERGIT